jgi:hypothetical protein
MGGDLAPRDREQQALGQAAMGTVQPADVLSEQQPSLGIRMAPVGSPWNPPRSPVR